MAVYKNLFEDKADIVKEFLNLPWDKEEAAGFIQKTLAEPEWQEMNVLYANYVHEGYSGSAFVLFERGGKLYEVHGSHCSCYGLEGQWEPEETNLEYLRGWLKEKEPLGYDSELEGLSEVLDELEKRDGTEAD